jgi:hypothetical protein
VLQFLDFLYVLRLNVLIKALLSRRVSGVEPYSCGRLAERQKPFDSAKLLSIHLISKHIRNLRTEAPVQSSFPEEEIISKPVNTKRI